VVQEFELGILTILELEVASSHLLREFEFGIVTFGNPYRNGRCERISPSEAMIHQSTS
jgi:hypothetical protein